MRSLGRIRRFPPIHSLAENEAFCDSLRQLLDEQYGLTASSCSDKAHSTTLLLNSATVIPNLSLGLSIASPYLAPDLLDSFMRRMLISRISRRVLAEHHIALSDSFARRGTESDNGERHVGIIYTGLNIKRSVEKCTNLLRRRSQRTGDNHTEVIPSGDWPDVVVDGHLHTNFAYIKEHLEFVACYLNFTPRSTTWFSLADTYSSSSSRTFVCFLFACVMISHAISNPGHVGYRLQIQWDACAPTNTRHNCGRDKRCQYPNIRSRYIANSFSFTTRAHKLIVGGGLLTTQIKSPSDLFSFSHVRNASRLEDSRLGALRTVSSSPRGVMATVDEQVGSFKEQQLDGPSLRALSEGSKNGLGLAAHPRIGIGLPMSNIFST